MNNQVEEMDQLVLVYGSLLSGHGNYNYIIAPNLDEKMEFVSDFETKPEYTMYSLGGFPAVICEGETSIKGELYRVKHKDAMRSLNSLEGHYGRNNPNNFYNTTDVETPYGNALMYTLDEARGYNQVESGNWRDVTGR